MSKRYERYVDKITKVLVSKINRNIVLFPLSYIIYLNKLSGYIPIKSIELSPLNFYISSANVYSELYVESISINDFIDTLYKFIADKHPKIYYSILLCNSLYNYDWVKYLYNNFVEIDNTSTIKEKTGKYESASHIGLKYDLDVNSLTLYIEYVEGNTSVCTLVAGKEGNTYTVTAWCDENPMSMLPIYETAVKSLEFLTSDKYLCPFKYYIYMYR